MGPKRSGPGALAGATEASSRCFRGVLHTSSEAAAQLACDGRTKLGRAFHAFSALPDRERAQRLLRFVRPANGRSWNIREQARHTRIPAESIMLALMTRGCTDGLTARIIEQMGWGAHLIIQVGHAGRLVPSGFRNVEAKHWLIESIAELHSDDGLVVQLRDLATLRVEDTARLLHIDHRDILARLHCHRLGGLFIDGTPFVSRLHPGRLGFLAASGPR